MLREQIMRESKLTGSESLKDKQELSPLGEACTERKRNGGRWGCTWGFRPNVKDRSCLRISRPSLVRQATGKEHCISDRRTKRKIFFHFYPTDQTFSVCSFIACFLELLLGYPTQYFLNVGKASLLVEVCGRVRCKDARSWIKDAKET